ncbi:MAG: hypothetical protein IT379_42105 [Deltaproteobacteria bacterium]|nr:hypothetical protein [Deltaproteobacteria bacterium]
MNRLAVVVLWVALAGGCVESSSRDTERIADGSPSATSASLADAEETPEEPVARIERRVAGLERMSGDLARQIAGFRREMNAGFLRVSLRPIALERSAAETCHEHGETCIAVRSSRTYDRRGRFWGHAVFSCSSRVVRRRHCLPAHDYYLTGPSSFHRPHDTQVSGMPNEGLCLSVPSYFAAVCAAPHASPIL